MIIIGVDFHPELIPTPESWRSADCIIRRKPKSSTAR
jgi:hypothetical protein